MRLETLAVLTALTGATAYAQDDVERYHFEVSADAVRLDVAVTSVEGRYVPGLTAADFRIYEDEVEQTVSHFTSELTPVSIVLLLDVSSSIQPSLDGIKAGAYRFVGGLRDGDTMLVGFFNHQLWFTNAFTDDPVALAREIRAMRASGMTALYDAILKSVDKLRAVAGRKALVIFADGDDSRPAAEGSVASRADALEAGKTKLRAHSKRVAQPIPARLHTQESATRRFVACHQSGHRRRASSRRAHAPGLLRALRQRSRKEWTR